MSNREAETLRLIAAIPDNHACYGCHVTTLRNGLSGEAVTTLLEEIALSPVTAESLSLSNEGIMVIQGELPSLKHRLAAECLIRRASGDCPIYQGETDV